VGELQEIIEDYGNWMLKKGNELIVMSYSLKELIGIMLIINDPQTKIVKEIEYGIPIWDNN